MADDFGMGYALGADSGNRNNNLLKYAMALVDSGMALIDVTKQVHAFNDKLNTPLDKSEIDSTILVSVAKRYRALSVPVIWSALRCPPTSSASNGSSARSFFRPRPAASSIRSRRPRSPR